MTYAKAWKCHRCPESNGAQGCPLWWEYQAENGKQVRGCGMSQKVLLPLLGASIQSSLTAAASADKAANVASGANGAAMSGMALVLGLASGQIRPPALERPEENLAIEMQTRETH